MRIRWKRALAVGAVGVVATVLTPMAAAHADGSLVNLTICNITDRPGSVPSEGLIRFVSRGRPSTLIHPGECGLARLAGYETEEIWGYVYVDGVPQVEWERTIHDSESTTVELF